MAWVDAGAFDAIPPRGARVLHVDGERIAVFRTSDDRVFALRDTCPHRGGPLSQGIVHGHCVTCPLHDWVIDLATGQATGPDEGVTFAYEARLEHGRVMLDVSRRETDADSVARSAAVEAG